MEAVTTKRSVWGKKSRETGSTQLLADCGVVRGKMVTAGGERAEKTEDRSICIEDVPEGF